MEKSSFPTMQIIGDDHTECMMVDSVRTSTLPNANQTHGVRNTKREMFTFGFRRGLAKTIGSSYAARFVSTTLFKVCLSIPHTDEGITGRLRVASSSSKHKSIIKCRVRRLAIARNTADLSSCSYWHGVLAENESRPQGYDPEILWNRREWVTIQDLPRLDSC